MTIAFWDRITRIHSKQNTKLVCLIWITSFPNMFGANEWVAAKSVLLGFLMIELQLLVCIYTMVFIVLGLYGIWKVSQYEKKQQRQEEEAQYRRRSRAGGRARS